MAHSRKPTTPESPVPENLSRGQRAAILEARRADPRRLITRTLEQTGQRHGMRQVWEDWIEALALVFANALGNRDERRRDDAWSTREVRYLQIVKRYDVDEWAAISDLLGPLSLAAELEGDILGELYMTLDFGNERAGQFFTPWHLCALNARLLVGDGEALRAEIVQNAGHVKVDDPACGSGTMLLAYAAAARELGFNPQTQLWFHDAPPAPEVGGPVDVVPAAPPIDHPDLSISISPLGADPPRSEIVDQHPATDPKTPGVNADEVLTPAPPPAPAETAPERPAGPPGQLSLL